MKRLFMTWVCGLLAVTSLLAEDMLQVRPCAVVPGSDSEDEENCFAIELNNEHTFVAMQFDLWLPEGMSITKGSFWHSEDRMPYTGKKKKDFFHEVTCVRQSGGQYRITCSSNDSENNQISGNSGTIFEVYYNTDVDMPAGILPIRITNVVLAIDGNHKVKPVDNVSFLYTPDVDFASVTSIDLTSVEGVTTHDVAVEARSLMTNQNALLYVNEGSAAEGLVNTVVGIECAALTLTDGHAFHAPRAFTAVSASYVRSVVQEGWYSLCLPFAAACPSNVQSVERFSHLDKAASEIYFNAGNVEADTPCIFQAEAGEVQFVASNAEINATPDELVDDVMRGYYAQTSPGDITACYALRADGSGFGVADATAYVTPFHAIVQAQSGAKLLRLRHDNATSITSAEQDKTTETLYRMDGIPVKQPTKGLHIRSGKKVIIK